MTFTECMPALNLQNHPLKIFLCLISLTKMTNAHSSLPLFSKERLLRFLKERSLFWKEQKRAIALLQRATKRAIALSKKSDKKSDRSFALSKRTKMSEQWAIFQIAYFSLKKKEQSLIFKMSKFPTLDVGLGNRSFPLLSKERLSNHLLIRSFKKSDRSFCCSFKKSDRSFSKWANAQPWFFENILFR